MSGLIDHAFRGNLKAVRELINAGVNIDAQDKYGRTALIRASRAGHLEIVKSLIRAGANLNVQGQAEWTIEEGWTALIHASRVGHLEVVKSLVDAGADLHLKTERRWTALEHALNQNHKEVVKVLEDAASKKARGSDPGDRNCKSVFDLILIDQASRGNLRAVKDLIDAGADLNLQDKDKWTALMSASLMGRLEIVKTLVDAGADLNLQDKYGKTALIHASLMGYLEIVKTLVDAGADPNLQDIDGLTALKRALNQNHKEVVKVLGDAASRKTRGSDPGDRRSSVTLNSLFAVLGYLAKVDGKVTQEEIGFVTNLMNEMQLDAEQRRQVEELFRMGKQAPAIALPILLSGLKNEYKNNPKSLQELMKILMQLVYLKRVISEQERLAIKEIATQLQISKSVLDDIEASLLSKSKDDKVSTSSSQSQHFKRDHQSAKKSETADPNHSKLVKISADLFEISGYLAKLDGRISREEIKSITNLMNEMQLERDQRRQAEDLFRRGKQASEGNMITLVSNLQDQYHETPEALNILVMILMQVAYSDGDMTDPEQQMIRTIAMQLSLDEIALNIIEVAVCCEIQNIKYLDLDDAYKMIGVSDTASHHDIKKAWLSLLRTYHPDALQSKGLPKEMLVFGKGLSQKFNLAYDRIKADRKF